jgi:ketosteroid isomerase-like protein
MSEENVELAQRASEMFNRRDLHGFLALMAEDVRFEPQMGPRFEGHDGIHRLWNSLIGGPGFTVEVVRLRDLGADLVLAAVHARGEGVGGSEQTYWVPSRWRQGGCFWWGVFLDEQEALKVLGLRE